MLILALLLQVAIETNRSCKATTNIPELKEGIPRACRTGLVSIDLSGNHDEVIETLVLDKDFVENTPALTPPWPSLMGVQAAMESDSIVQKLYPTAKFVWRVKDRTGRPLCHFTITEGSTTGRCAEELE